MLDSYKQKELERISNLVADYQKDIDTLAEDAKAVDEKYRLLAEQEKADIVSTVDYLTALMEDCKAKLLVLSGDTTLSAPEKKVRKRKLEPVAEQKTEEPAEEKPAEEPEKVVDTLFPENNEAEPELESEETKAVAPEEENMPLDMTTDGEPWDDSKIENPFEETSWEMPKEWE